MNAPLFPRRCPPHRRRAAWSAWWDAQRRLRTDQRFVHSPGFEPDEDDWLRLSERGVLIGTTGFVTPGGLLNDGPWPMHGGYFEKPAFWVRGGDPFDWIGRGRRRHPGVEIRPCLVGIALSPIKDLTLDRQDRLTSGSRVETLPDWPLLGEPHRFNPTGTPITVAAFLEQRPRGRPFDDHPVVHAFGPAWWTRPQVEAVVDRVMELVRDRLPDGQWLDPVVLREGPAFARTDTRAAWRDRIGELIDFCDFRSTTPDVLPSPGDRRVLIRAGGDRLLRAAEAQWKIL